MAEVVEINIIVNQDKESVKNILNQLLHLVVSSKSKVIDKTIKYMDNWEYENIFSLENIEQIEDFIDEKIILITETLYEERSDRQEQRGIYIEPLKHSYALDVWYNSDDMTNDLQYHKYIDTFIRFLSENQEFSKNIKLCAIGKEIIFGYMENSEYTGNSEYMENLAEMIHNSHNVDIWIARQEIVKHKSEKRESIEHESVKYELRKHESAKYESGKHESAKYESVKYESVKHELGKHKSAKYESEKQESTKERLKNEMCLKYKVTEIDENFICIETKKQNYEGGLINMTNSELESLLIRSVHSDKSAEEYLFNHISDNEIFNNLIDIVENSFSGDAKMEAAYYISKSDEKFIKEAEERLLPLMDIELDSISVHIMMALSKIRSERALTKIMERIRPVLDWEAAALENYFQ